MLEQKALEGENIRAEGVRRGNVRAECVRRRKG